MTRRDDVAVTVGAIREGCMIEPVLRPIDRVVAIRALTGIVLRLTVTLHAVLNPCMLEHDSDPVTGDVTIGALSGIVTER